MRPFEWRHETEDSSDLEVERGDVPQLEGVDDERGESACLTATASDGQLWERFSECFEEPVDERSVGGSDAPLLRLAPILIRNALALSLIHI